MGLKKEEKDTVIITVDTEEDLHITITIGNAQIGAGVVFFESNQIAKGDIQNLYLGKGKSLHGKKCKVVTNVLDANPATNAVVIVHDFDNGVPSSHTYKGKLDNEGDIYSLVTTYKFV
ncbi:MAG: hypothetical protein R2800_03670 [Flavipsychrobacter sp.]